MTYTSKVLRKEQMPTGEVKIHVEFTNGTKTVTDACVPQDRYGFEFWLDSKLKALNMAEIADQELPDGAEVVPTINQQPEPPQPTAEQIAFKTWLAKYLRLVEIHQKLIVPGVIPETNAKFVSLRDEVRAGLQNNPGYFDKLPF